MNAASRRTKNAADSLPGLLTVEALAARWTLKPDTIRAWARRGVLPSLKLGRKRMFREADLRDFLEREP